MQNFISVFSVYFTASIGILAGANVSGHLKVRLEINIEIHILSKTYVFDLLWNPNKAIPKGTIWAIIYCSLSYAIIAVIFAATMAREGKKKLCSPPFVLLQIVKF